MAIVNEGITFHLGPTAETILLHLDAARSGDAISRNYLINAAIENLGNQKFIKFNPDGTHSNSSFRSFTNYKDVVGKFYEALLSFQECPQNKVARGHREPKVITGRGSKFGNPRKSSATIYVSHQNYLPHSPVFQENAHARGNVWVLGACGALVYKRGRNILDISEVAPWIPEEINIEMESPCSSKEELVQRVISYDDAKHAVSKKEYTHFDSLIYGTDGIHVHVVQKILLKIGIAKTQKELARNPRLLALGKIFTEVANTTTWKFQALEDLGMEKPNTARFVWGVCKEFVPTEEKLQQAAEQLAGVLNSEIEMPAKAKTFLVDYINFRDVKATRFQNEYTYFGNELKFQEEVGARFMAALNEHFQWNV